MLSSFAAEADDRFVFRRRLLILVIFCVAILNTALVVPSEKFSDSFLETAMEVFAVIVGISISVVCLMWICNRVLGGDDRGEIYGIRVDAETSRAESTYDNLSRHQKRRLDRMRSDAIRHLLVDFSLKLTQENMISSSNKESAESDELLEHRTIPITDEEEGNHDASESNKYTHVMIHQHHHDSEEDKNSSTREVPNSCAICLTEYEVSDNISWSANPQCPHVFHEKCITKWFLSLGRLQTVCGVSLEDDCPKNVLNYQLECPCCRQEFISTQD